MLRWRTFSTLSLESPVDTGGPTALSPASPVDMGVLTVGEAIFGVCLDMLKNPKPNDAPCNSSLHRVRKKTGGFLRSRVRLQSNMLSPPKGSGAPIGLAAVASSFAGVGLYPLVRNSGKSKDSKRLAPADDFNRGDFVTGSGTSRSRCGDVA